MAFRRPGPLSDACADADRVRRRARLKQAYREAARDPVYQAEMAEIDRAFDVTVGDGLEDDPWEPD